VTPNLNEFPERQQATSVLLSQPFCGAFFEDEFCATAGCLALF